MQLQLITVSDTDTVTGVFTVTDTAVADTVGHNYGYSYGNGHIRQRPCTPTRIYGSVAVAATAVYADTHRGEGLCEGEGLVEQSRQHPELVARNPGEEEKQTPDRQERHHDHQQRHRQVPHPHLGRKILHN